MSRPSYAWPFSVHEIGAIQEEVSKIIGTNRESDDSTSKDLPASDAPKPIAQPFFAVAAWDTGDEDN